MPIILVESTQRGGCGRLKEQESISDDHLRASGPWLVRAVDPLRSTPDPEAKKMSLARLPPLVELIKYGKQYNSTTV